MPTPILPLLHALLDALFIPIHPQTLSSTSPSLLLLILETINGEKLPLPKSLRNDTLHSPQDSDTNEQVATELELIKCLLGTLDEQLSKDLTVVDPRRVVEGRQEELGVVIMALTVLARRRGIRIRVPSPTYDGFEGGEWEEEEDSLVKPLQPDISLSPRLDGDVFASGPERDQGYQRTSLFGLSTEGHGMDLANGSPHRAEDSSMASLGQQSPASPVRDHVEYETPLTSKGHPNAVPTHVDAPREEYYNEQMHRPLDIDAWLRHDETDHDSFDDRAYRHLSSPSHNASSSTGNSVRTVLDDIIEEFGLAPDP